MNRRLDELPVPLPQVELIEEDGEPLESDWHRLAMNLLIEVAQFHLGDRPGFVGGNMFIYFSEEQARNRDFRGPDFFYVRDASPMPLRPYWALWLEGGRYPDVIIELLSPKTAELDRTVKKDVYQRVFHTAEYYCYDPDARTLQGWRLVGGEYEELKADESGWLWCGELGLWLGKWDGWFMGREGTWLRFYDVSGKLVPTYAEAGLEQLNAAKQQADVERQRAEVAEAELARLKAQLSQEGNKGKSRKRKP
jgi:Uma2 family endonuclease